MRRVRSPQGVSALRSTCAACVQRVHCMCAACTCRVHAVYRLHSSWAVLLSTCLRSTVSVVESKVLLNRAAQELLKPGMSWCSVCTAQHLHMRSVCGACAERVHIISVSTCCVDAVQMLCTSCAAPEQVLISTCLESTVSVVESKVLLNRTAQELLRMGTSWAGHV